MDVLSPLVSAVVAAAVSVAVTLGFRWWDRRSVRWVLTGEAHHHYRDGRRSGLVKANITFHNTGDGDAFEVRMFGSTAGPQWERFLVGKVAAGGSIDQEVFLDPEDYEKAWIEVVGIGSPTHARRREVRKRWQLSTLGALGEGPPRVYP